VDTVFGLALITLGAAIIVWSRQLSERLRRDRWPFGNVYALRLVNEVSSSRAMVVVFGCGAILIGGLALVG
jgi:hypothetical protein